MEEKTRAYEQLPSGYKDCKFVQVGTGANYVYLVIGATVSSLFLAWFLGKNYFSETLDMLIRFLYRFTQSPTAIMVVGSICIILPFIPLFVCRKRLSAAHENIHQWAFRSLGGQAWIDIDHQPPCCGSDWFYTRNAFIFASLCPGFVLCGFSAIITLFLPDAVKIVGIIYFAIFLTTAAGDIFSSLYILRWPKDCLVKDDGRGFHIYVVDPLDKKIK